MFLLSCGMYHVERHEADDHTTHIFLSSSSICLLLLMLPMIRYFGDVQKAAHVIMLSGGLGALVVVSHFISAAGLSS
jgi:hypothetical protein